MGLLGLLGALSGFGSESGMAFTDSIGGMVNFLLVFGDEIFLSVP